MGKTMMATTGWRLRWISRLLLTVAVTLFPLTSLAGPWPMYRQNLQHTGRSDVDTSGNQGMRRWAFATGTHISSSAAIDADGTIYVGSAADHPGDEGGLFAINADGSQKWANTFPGALAESSPAIGADGTIYLGFEGAPAAFYAFNANGSVKWSFPGTGEGGVFSSPAIGSDGTIYFGTLAGNLYALNADGTEKWKFNTGSPRILSSPAIATDGTIYVASENGNNTLHALNPDGTEKWAVALNVTVRLTTPTAARC